MNKYSYLDSHCEALSNALPRTPEAAIDWLDATRHLQRALPSDYDGHPRARLAQSVAVVQAHWRHASMSWKRRQQETGQGWWPKRI